MSKEPVPKSYGANNYRRHRQGEREDKEGRPYTVRYDAVNAMLLNELLKKHRKNEEQGATIARRRKKLRGYESNETGNCPLEAASGTNHRRD